MIALACVWTGTDYAQDTTNQTPEAPKQETPAKKKALTFEDFKQWERLNIAVMSNDGKFLVYGVSKIDADGYLIARRIDGPEKALIPNGGRPAISDSSNWAAYLISMSKAEVEKNNEMKKPSPTKLGIRNLETGEERIIEDIATFDFLKDQDMMIAMRPKMTPGPGGSDLLIMNPAGGEPTVISNVANYGLNDSETLLAVQINSGTGYQAFEVIDIKTGTIHPLYSGKEDVASFSWSKKADVLSVVIAKPDEKKEGNTHKIWRVSGFDGSISRQELDPTKFEGFPAGMRIAEGMRIGPCFFGSTVDGQGQADESKG